MTKDEFYAYYLTKRTRSKMMKKMTSSASYMKKKIIPHKHGLINYLSE